jgi:hypothetical protein
MVFVRLVNKFLRELLQLTLSDPLQLKGEYSTKVMVKLEFRIFLLFRFIKVTVMAYFIVF